MSLPEMILTTALYTVVLGVLFAIVKTGTDSWREVQARSAAQLMLRNVENYMLDDLRRAGAGESLMKTKNLGDGKFAMWFLSAMGYDDVGDTNKQVFTRSVAGAPVWKRNILYYVIPISPEWHEKRFGYKICPPATCPHKLLLRKEIVYPGDTSNNFVEATLIPDLPTSGSGVYIDNFIGSTPNNLDFRGELTDANKLRTRGCKSCICLGENIKDFSVTIPALDASGLPTQSWCTIKIGVFRADDAARTINVQKAMEAINSSSDQNLINRFMMTYEFRVVPNN
ncbi:hypothetical protein IJT17_06900 [bacterium]|nr:hypothetical protein [bacterium]